MMSYRGSAYARPALAPACSVTTAAASQNRSVHLYLGLVATETSLVVLAQILTTPPASKQTASVNIMLVVSSLSMTFHNLSWWMS